MPKHYDYEAVKRMRVLNLAVDIGLSAVGESVSFVVNGGDIWTATIEDRDGKRWIVIKTEMQIGDYKDVMHFEGPMHSNMIVRDLRPC
jgi:hypothetical protein